MACIQRRTPSMSIPNFTIPVWAYQREQQLPINITKNIPHCGYNEKQICLNLSCSWITLCKHSCLNSQRCFFKSYWYKIFWWDDLNVHLMFGLMFGFLPLLNPWWGCVCVRERERERERLPSYALFSGLFTVHKLWHSFDMGHHVLDA